MAYKKLSELPIATSITDDDIILMTDVEDGTSKKLPVSLLRSQIDLDSDEVVNASEVPGTTLTQALDYLLNASWQQLGFESKQEIVALTSDHISHGFIELINQPVTALNPRVELINGQVQINKLAISVYSGEVTPNYEFDTNHPRRLYIKNVPANYEGEGNVEHAGLSSDFEAGQIILITYLYAAQPGD